MSTHRERPAAIAACWAALGASFLLSWETWVQLAMLAGFTGHLDAVRLPVLGVEVTPRLAWGMGIAVDGYIVAALVTWMAPVSQQVADFAKKNTYAGALVSVAAQSVYHGLWMYGNADSLSMGLSALPMGILVPFAALVGMLPPLCGALAVHMRALVRRNREDAAPATTDTADEDLASEAPADVPAEVPVPAAPSRPRLVPVPSPVVPAERSRDIVTEKVSPSPRREHVPPVHVPASPRDAVPAPKPAPAEKSPSGLSPVPDWAPAVRGHLAKGHGPREIFESLPGTWRNYEQAKKAIQRFRKKEAETR